jgi:hypothetical protein
MIGGVTKAILGAMLVAVAFTGCRDRQPVPELRKDAPGASTDAKDVGRELGKAARDARDAVRDVGEGIKDGYGGSGQPDPTPDVTKDGRGPIEENTRPRDKSGVINDGEGPFESK